MSNSNSFFAGSLVALITPFDEAGEIDFGALGALIEFQAMHGTDGLFFMSPAGGEAAMLTQDEQKSLIVETAKRKPDGLPFFYGCSGSSTKNTIERVRIAAENGADGAILTLPAAVGPNQDESVRYFLDVAEASDLPLGIFNNPARAMTDLSAETLLRVFSHPRFVMHKEGSSRTGQLASILAGNSSIALMTDDSPDPDMLACGMALGAHGLSSIIGNIAPAETAEIARPWRDDFDLERFRELYFQLVPLMAYAYGDRSPKPTKALMNLLGLPAGKPRAPLQPLEAPAAKKIIEHLRGSGIIERYNYV